MFAVNDNTAIGVLAAAHALGLRVPDEVSIVGYDDIPGGTVARRSWSPRRPLIPRASTAAFRRGAG